MSTTLPTQIILIGPSLKWKEANNKEGSFRTHLYTMAAVFRTSQHSMLGSFSNSPTTTIRYANH